MLVIRHASEVKKRYEIYLEPSKAMSSHKVLAFPRPHSVIIPTLCGRCCQSYLQIRKWAQKSRALHSRGSQKGCLIKPDHSHSSPDHPEAVLMSSPRCGPVGDCVTRACIPSPLVPLCSPHWPSSTSGCTMLPFFQGPSTA